MEGISGAGEPIQSLVAQYRDSANLGARIFLHERFGGGQMPWQRWIFDRIGLQVGERLLEVGCGPGRLWEENRDRWPPVSVFLTDLSEGMVRPLPGWRPKSRRRSRRQAPSS